jgi:hypothetical protein
MALGPKAMGEAIIANLKVKTDKDLRAWLAVLKTAQPDTKGEAITLLRSEGLGHFQAVAIAETYFDDNVYTSPKGLIDALFAQFTAERTLFDEICEECIDGVALRVQPCRGYVPIYSQRNVVIASFKPTPHGLYLGLRGDGFTFATIDHKRGFGGTESMRRGLYLPDRGTGVAALREAHLRNSGNAPERVPKRHQ